MACHPVSPVSACVRVPEGLNQPILLPLTAWEGCPLLCPGSEFHGDAFWSVQCSERVMKDVGFSGQGWWLLWQCQDNSTIDLLS